ncbi:VanZ family protein [Tissierella creatinini]|nr:VanZ family protein [Tissierella creatinini]TJX47407.1 VanZ family protein [Soehngenia saccharolytica]
MIRKVLPWILVVLWMVFIFYQSHKPAPESNKLSKGITEIIVETVEKVTPDVEIEVNKYHHTIRKNAHFLSYLLLGILVANGLRNSGVNIGLAVIICVLYAISDEIHQLYVPGRSGEVKDVIIDSAGALVGILGYGWFAKILSRSGLLNMPVKPPKKSKKY